MIDKVQNTISSNEDVDKLAKVESQKLNSIHLNLKEQSIDKTKFSELFKKLQDVKNLEKVELDLTKFQIDNEQIDMVNKFLKSQDNLKEVYIHVSESNFEDSQFDKLLNDSLKDRKSLEKLHLFMENVNMNDEKRKSIQKLVQSLSGLKNVYLNMQRNYLTQDDMSDLHHLIFHFPHRVLLW
jgi:hypothetical protein